MTKLNILLSCLLISGYSLADDTEIYGAAAIDEDSKINSNVLFIVDNSGSMRGAVEYFTEDYNPATEYIGAHNKEHIYIDRNANYWDGIPLSTLLTDYSTNCTETVNTLNNSGEVTGKYEQFYYYRRNNQGWSSYLDTNSDYAIRCQRNGSSRTLYSGNFLNYYNDPNNRKASTRMEVVKKIVSDLTYSLKNVNVGMMRFDTGSDPDDADKGGMVEVAIDDIKNNAQDIRDTVGTYQPYSWTPLSETLYEAQRYYSGSNVEFGNDASPVSSDSSRKSSNTSETDYNVYSSPIEQSCQKNHIIMLTDGDPSRDVGANSDIQNLIKGLDLPSDLSHSCSGDGGCLAELAYYMNTVDQSPDHNGAQLVSTYTVGAFGGIKDTDLLKKTAKHGGGSYYGPQNPDDLSTAINSIILEILAKDSTFTAPAISVNAFNNSQHSGELFYALFKPNDKAEWQGNLKKYSLGSDGKIYDKNSVLAVDASTGFFSKQSQDYWSQATSSEDEDGKDITLGGAANLLNPADRVLYSDVDNRTLGSFDAVATESSLAVGASAVNNLKSWIRGFDVNNDSTKPRHYLGDPLHSEPVVITYGGDKDNPDNTIYFGSNQGFIHAISANNTGKEEFAFMPKELHSIQNIFYENNTPAGIRPYGMDGPITSWMYDLNANNVIYNESKALESGEHVYIYAGMRRGGRSYYGLNVTDRSTPSLLFKIEGGVTTGFEKLGQTWSKMTIAKVMFNGAQRFVLFFTGGYDTNQDGNNITKADSVGNAIYMVDASDGTLLWTASNKDADLNIPEMINSIPASLSAIDITGEGNVDYLIAADTGGRVFRIDIKQGNSGKSDFAKGGTIASLAGIDEANKRRFYNKPNVALVKDKQKGDYLTVAIGSGYRAHPLDKNIQDRFYMIKDFHPYSAPSSYVTITEAPTSKTSLGDSESADPTKLYNATKLMLNGETALTSSMQALMNNGGGWYVTFANAGEKVLSESTTFAGAIIFTTFSPSSGTISGCSADTGQSKTYAISQTGAMAVIDLDGDGDLEANDSSIVLAQSGIAPRPIVIYRPGGGKTIAIGTENIDDNRFSEDPAQPDKSTEQECTTGNCYVIPEYWRQNDKVQ